MPVPQMQEAPTRNLLRDEVYISLRDAIVDGTLAPGESLKDPELERWLGVSRTPIREALQRLERSGLVVTRRNRSTTVAPVDPDQVAQAQQVVAAMHELATRLAVPRLTAGDIESMTKANQRFAQALDAGDSESALAADDDLHEVLVAASGNDTIREVLEQTSPVLRRVERLRFSTSEARESVTLHTQIIAAAQAGEAERAASLVRQNWLSLLANS
jgi:DNA-binding GntR family transcriptional regulator